MILQQYWGWYEVLKRSLVLVLGVIFLSLLPLPIIIFNISNYIYIIILSLLEIIISFFFSIIGTAVTFKKANMDNTLKGAVSAIILYIGHVLGSIITVLSPDYKVLAEKISTQLGSDIQIVSPLAINSLITSFLIFLLLGSFAGWLTKRLSGVRNG